MTIYYTPESRDDLQKIKESVSGYRFLFCKHNYIFYRVEKDTVRIVRILNEKQEYMRVLFGISEDE